MQRGEAFLRRHPRQKKAKTKVYIFFHNDGAMYETMPLRTSRRGGRPCGNADMNSKHEEGQMRRFFSLVISISLIAVAGAAKAENSVTVTSEGWSVTVDKQQHTLSISHETLGTVLTDVGVNLRGERGLNRLTKWSVERKGQNQLSIRTAGPPTVWLIELALNTFKISSTSTDGVLTAKAPAPTDRIVARVLDPPGGSS